MNPDSNSIIKKINTTVLGKLILEDGTEITGKSFGAQSSTAGEVVFNTAMNGYPENFTDPSYHGQILVLTSPMVGNYGVPPFQKVHEIESYFESSKIHIKGLIINYYAEEYNHWNAVKSLAEWLKENQIPALYDVDTRWLTQRLRENGSMLGKIEFIEKIEFFHPNSKNLVEEVSIKDIKIYPSPTPNGKKVVLVDCGVKNNILRCLLKRGIEIIRVPWNYDFNTLNCDGIVISNGPGDPQKCEATIYHLQQALLKNKPILGICLGNQLLALASGAKTFKLKYGHRSYNQPVREVGTNRCFITSQNHGFAIEEKSLQPPWKPYFVNLNDGTLEGIRHAEKPFFSVQFHPEASGGPNDTEFLFDDFINRL